MKLICQNLDNKWGVRSKKRSQEILAVSEALHILTEDDAQERPSTELGSSMRAARPPCSLGVFDVPPGSLCFIRTNCLRHGAAAGPRAQSSTLAVTVQLDAYTKVKEATDKMVEELKAEQQEEVQFKASWDKRFHENEQET